MVWAGGDAGLGGQVYGASGTSLGLVGWRCVVGRTKTEMPPSFQLLDLSRNAEGKARFVAGL